MGAGGAGTGSEAVPAVAVMVATDSKLSNCDVHDAPEEESISVPNALPGAPGLLEVARSSPVVMQFADTDSRND
jgi:hypothetical protein